jgi:hypothetical protein
MSYKADDPRTWTDEAHPYILSTQALRPHELAYLERIRELQRQLKEAQDGQSVQK